MGDTAKKQWVRPKLIVLVRTRSEERILGACKQKGGRGPHQFPDYCHTPPACTGVGQS